MTTENRTLGRRSFDLERNEEMFDKMSQLLKDHDRSWHIDKKIPISLILAIMMQTASFVWWVAQTNARLSNLETSGATQAWVAGKDSFVAATSNRFDKLEESLEDSMKSVELMREKLIYLDIMIKATIKDKSDTSDS